ncbi:CIA30 family protein-like protein [Biscogniauxia sp. FL1348]|nr:CIA30 family protein-like protein [Biscogniauxia sp. FL1348]
MESPGHLIYLFGGDRPWLEDTWVASDDRVRGGDSQSYLEPSAKTGAARFHGRLDITALGGAGFASQRSPDGQPWDLSGYQALRLGVNQSDGKKYTLILKDEILPRRPDGREQSTVSWEYDFICQRGELDISFEDFKPTYRGRAKPDAKPLDLTSVKRISFMMRSFFGEQEGPFELEIQYIAAMSSDKSQTSSDLQLETRSSEHSLDLGKQRTQATGSSWFSCLQGLFKRGQ